MSRATCYVSARDYQQHFEGKGAIAPPAATPTWTGAERRVATRRTERTRRYRLTDRRKDSTR